MIRKIKNKIPVIVVAVCIAVVILVVNFFSLLSAAAIHYINKSEYEKACYVLKFSKSDEGFALLDYAVLRSEMKTEYPLLLQNFDRDKIEKWRNSAQELVADGKIHNPKIRNFSEKIFENLEKLLSMDEAYSDIETNIDSLLDVFKEYNRLHVKTNGENASFVPAEEYQKLDLWQRNLEKIKEYSLTLPDFENVYLLSYFLKESQSEIIQLREEMDSVIKSGYSINDTVRYSDNTARNFPTINNGDKVITFSDKALFEESLHGGIQYQLVSELLVEYYYK